MGYCDEPSCGAKARFIIDEEDEKSFQVRPFDLKTISVPVATYSNRGGVLFLSRAAARVEMPGLCPISIRRQIESFVF